MTKNGAHPATEADEAAEEQWEEPGPSSSFPIVGVGASAGGLEAFTQFLGALPGDTGMAFVLVQHLAPAHESKLASLLAKVTPMPVLEASRDLAVRPNHVYVIPKNTTLTIAQGVLQVAPRGEARGPHLPIDLLLKSLAEDQQTAAIGVILSGTGSDGTLGLAEIKAVGGVTFAQDKESAKHDGMPASAIGSGTVDFILPPEEIARELARIGHHPYLAPRPFADRRPPAAGEESFRKILALLRSAFGVDFTHYRDTTIRRRTLRRMALHAQESLADYARRLEEDRSELQALYQDILINVTSFFRDPAMFEALETSVFPAIMKTKSAGLPVRVWTAGCSTGQEAYSLAIALVEFLDDKPVRPSSQIFATDLSDTTSLEKARAGLYPESIESEVSPERLRRFFTKEDGKYRISKSIRDMCVFAKQNILADPPFSRMDLISCCNVLIYLSPPLQKRVIPTFHYALNPSGFLMLGTSETIGEFSDLFAVVDKPHKIYSKKPTAFRQYPHFNAGAYLAGVPGETRGAPQPSLNPADLQKEADRIVLGRYAPAGVLVNDNLEILQFRGRTGPYLEPAMGTASLNLLKMAREGLFVELKNALDEAKNGNATVERPGVRVRDDNHVREVNLKVVPVKLPGMGECYFLVLFEEAGPLSGPSTTASGRAAGSRSGEAARAGSWIKQLFAPRPAVGDADREAIEDRDRELVQLRRELVAAREHQQLTSEQHDAANEELKSANEEILSANEELQSTNEELETAKEELQSVNEELTTVNEQLQNRNVELNRLNDDLVNLLGSGNVPMVVLGIDLRLRRFTAAAGKVLNLLSTDVGRPIGDLRLTVDVPDLEPWLLDVIATVQVKEREVRDREGRWHALRIHPYRTTDHKIDGAVMVLADIHEAKSTQVRLKEAGDYARAIVETVREPLLILTADLRVNSANRSFYETFRVTPGETEGRFLYDLGGGRWDIPPLRTLLEDILRSDRVVEDFEVEQEFPGVGRRVMLFNARRLVQQNGATHLILLAIEDITERRRAEAGVRASEVRYRRLFESARDGILMLDADTRRITDANPFMTEFLGYSREELLGKELWEIGLLTDQEASQAAFRELQETGDIRYEDLPLQTKEGDRREVEFVSNLYREDGQQVIQCNIRDVTARKREEQALRESQEALKDADRRKNEFLAMLAHELRNPLAAISNAVHVSSRPETDAVTLAWGREVIERQIKNFARLIDDLLDISRITQGKVQLHKEPVELGTLAALAVAAVRHHIDAREHELSISLPEGPVCLQADPTRLEQILVNLVGNAAKYTEPGGRIWLEVQEQGEDVIIAVRDTGVGIPPEMLPRVFDLFTQVERSSDRAHGGLGIGLTLVRSLVELHGGSVSASSTLGEGSVFTVRLPLGVVPPEEDHEPRTAPATGAPTHRILIVDDNRDTAQSLAQLLQYAGHDVQTSYDGPSALEAACAHRPDVILLDIGLPGMSGYEVAARLRQEEVLEDSVIIAISGYGQGTDRSRSQEAGCDDHLVKPVDFDTLLALLADTTKRQTH